MKRVRDPFWDAVKGIGYCCVLLGHIVGTRYIFNFHMPLFFLVSGLFFRANGGMRRAVRNVMVPWIYFFVICLVLSVFSYGGVNVYKLLVTSLIGRPYVCNSLWFLTCMLWVQLFSCAIAFFCARCANDWRWLFPVLAISLACAYVAARFPDAKLYYFPFMVRSVPMGLFFFMIGFGCKEVVMKIASVKRSVTLVSLVVLGACYCAISYLNGYSNMMYPVYSSFVWFVVAALIGVAVVFMFVRFIGNGPVLNALAWIGERSICFFLIEEYSIRYAAKIVRNFWPGAMSPVYSIPTDSDTILWKMLIGLVAFGISLVVVPALTKGLNCCKMFLVEKSENKLKEDR